MLKTAFLFPGQGSQSVGMGKLLSQEFPSARLTFEEADEALGWSISRLCFEGPEDELKKTENTQPALVAASIAAFRVLSSLGFKPDVVAGHSLGEYSALVAAGSLEFPEALKLVKKRGLYMQEAVPLGTGAMAALLKLPTGTLEGLLRSAAQGEVLTIANLNSPDQVVVAGNAAAIQRLVDLAKAAGARKAVVLPVSAPFHCPLMRPAQARLKIDLDAASFSDLTVPLVNNWQAEAVQTATEARDGLYQQVPKPVRWTESVHKIASLGVQRFVEVGPGSVLTGLCRQIVPDLNGVKFGVPQDLEKVRNVLA